MMINTTKRIANNIFELTTRRGDIVTIHFTEEDNPDIEDIVTDNLLTSYERRIGEMTSENFNKV